MAKPILEATGIDGDTPLEISTDGDVMVTSPVPPEKCTARVEEIADEIFRKHADLFRRLAE